MTQTRLETGDWKELGDRATTVRHEVFVVEQNIPAELEWDENDSKCLHALVTTLDGKPVGTGRLLPDGYIGRMAVLSDYRKLNLGAKILQLLVEKARQRGHAVVSLNAQRSAVDFYAKQGFQIEGEVFYEAGIEHVLMVKFL